MTNGFLTGVKVAAGWHAESEPIISSMLEWTMTRGNRGELLSETRSWNGATKNVSYDFGATVVSEQIYASGESFQYEHDDRGAISVVTDPNSLRTILTRDGLDRIVKVEIEQPNGKAAMSLIVRS